MKLGEIMYKQNQQDPNKTPEPNNDSSNKQENKNEANEKDDIVDADFEEVQDKQDDKEQKSS